jgi:histidinol-phosphate aminotransferase
VSAVAEKGGGTFHGIKLLLCENPLPPLEEAVAAAQAAVPHGNYYTDAYSAPLRRLIAQCRTQTRLLPERDFAFDLSELAIPQGITLAVIVNPNNPNGGAFDIGPLPNLLRRHPKTTVALSTR